MFISDVISRASNIKVGVNPPFVLDDFYSIYPQFKSMKEIPEEVAEMYMQFANDCVKERVWKKQWKLGMSLFIAHFLTLYLQSFVPTNTSARQVVAASQSKGILSSKSVGDVSVSYDFGDAVDGLESWGQWKTTAFGLQFITIAKLLNKGGMLVW